MAVVRLVPIRAHPSSPDPVEWAAKAAQWAQQRLMQDQYAQHMNQWQQQQQQPVMHPPSHHQPTPELKQHVSPELLLQAEQRNIMAGHMQQDGAMASHSHMQQDGTMASHSHMQQDGAMASHSHMQQDGTMASHMQQDDTLVSASPQQQPSPAQEPSRGREDYHGGVFSEGRQYHPRDNFGTPRREFPPRGRESYQNDFQFRSPRPHGFERPPRPHGFERSPRPRAFEGGPLLPHRWEKEGFIGEKEEPRPPPPTESYFAGETSDRSNNPSVYEDYHPSSSQETLPKMDYSERESYEDNRFQREKFFAGGRDQGVELERFECEIKETSTEQDEWLYGGRKQPVGQFETEAVQRRPQPLQQPQPEKMDDNRSPRDQQQTPRTIPQDQSSFHQHDQEQLLYHQQSQETFSYHQEKPPYNEVGRTSATKNQATISSLSKSPAVIPGLGEYEERGSPVPNSQGNRDSSHAKRENESPQPQTTQVIESLGKIVSQLQTLQGLTSSLQLLQTLPKGQPEATKTAREGEKAREAAQREREVSEETKRKVAALLANDSDSEGEQVHV